mmetsp:Transcript_19319/g.74076  ORF Transcript_19319/g.74076 Transcript_19319/m.74076 type:complete len:796 (-) Transcript_19319:1195-3582(-)
MRSTASWPSAKASTRSPWRRSSDDSSERVAKSSSHTHATPLSASRPRRDARAPAAELLPARDEGDGPARSARCCRRASRSARDRALDGLTAAAPVGDWRRSRCARGPRPSGERSRGGARCCLAGLDGPSPSLVRRSPPAMRLRLDPRPSTVRPFCRTALGLPAPTTIAGRPVPAHSATAPALAPSPLPSPGAVLQLRKRPSDGSLMPVTDRGCRCAPDRRGATAAGVLAATADEASPPAGRGAVAWPAALKSYPSGTVSNGMRCSHAPGFSGRNGGESAATEDGMAVTCGVQSAMLRKDTDLPSDPTGALATPARPPALMLRPKCDIAGAPLSSRTHTGTRACTTEPTPTRLDTRTDPPMPSTTTLLTTASPRSDGVLLAAPRIAANGSRTLPDDTASGSMPGPLSATATTSVARAMYDRMRSTSPSELRRSIPRGRLSMADCAPSPSGTTRRLDGTDAAPTLTPRPPHTWPGARAATPTRTGPTPAVASMPPPTSPSAPAPPATTPAARSPSLPAPATQSNDGLCESSGSSGSAHTATCTSPADRPAPLDSGHCCEASPGADALLDTPDDSRSVGGGSWLNANDTALRHTASSRSWSASTSRLPVHTALGPGTSHGSGLTRLPAPPDASSAHTARHPCDDGPRRDSPPSDSPTSPAAAAARSPTGHTLTLRRRPDAAVSPRNPPQIRRPHASSSRPHAAGTTSASALALALPHSSSPSRCRFDRCTLARSSRSRSARGMSCEPDAPPGLRRARLRAAALSGPRERMETKAMPLRSLREAAVAALDSHRESDSTA